MAVSFPRLPRWLCGRTNKEKETVSSNASSKSPSADTVKCPLKAKPSGRRTKRRWLGKEEEPVGNVVCPEPDGPEWSIGWVEPHGSGFGASDDTDGGFVVLVPCYKKFVEGSSNQLFGAINKVPPTGFSPPDGKKYMEKWLSSLQNL